MDSIAATTQAHGNVELVLIDNGSSDPETLTLVERLADRADVQRRSSIHGPSTGPQLNNAGAQVARGDVLLFLNNDIEARRQGWLSALCAQALRPDVAAVGARLLYPDRRLQHCGLVVGLTGAAGHPLAGLPERCGRATCTWRRSTRECSAVTGACLATRREVFERLDGFDESLGVDLNDVDYCLRAVAEGLPHRLRARRRADPPRVAEPWHRRRRRRRREVRRSMEGLHYARGIATSTHISLAPTRRAGWLRAEEEDAWNRWYSTLTMQ